MFIHLSSRVTLIYCQWMGVRNGDVLIIDLHSGEVRTLQSFLLILIGTARNATVAHGLDTIFYVQSIHTVAVISVDSRYTCSLES